jgi:heme A synthase
MNFKRLLADRPAFHRYALAVLIYNYAVILWGAVVRATGSGAGCGAHWPTCQGQVIPQAPQVATLIEFIHRLMSGLTVLLTAALVLWAWRAFAKGSPVRRAAGFSGFFIITESLVGAGLVLFGLTAENATAARAFAIMIHLANTLLLLASITLTWWFSGAGEGRAAAGLGREKLLLGAGLLAFIVLGATGAVTALGDTLFPASSLVQGFAQDFSAETHFLLRLRTIHPALAVGLGLYLNWAAWLVQKRLPRPAVQRLARWVVALFFVQLALGALNVLLLAPVWMQLVHLLATDLLWAAAVILLAQVWWEPAAPTKPAV